MSEKTMEDYAMADTVVHILRPGVESAARGVPDPYMCGPKNEPRDGIDDCWVYSSEGSATCPECIRLFGARQTLGRYDPRWDAVGFAADTLDNLIHAMSLPMPPAFHVDRLRGVLPGVRDRLREAFVAATGQNPWLECEESE